jgi:hypothetical protein
MKKVAKLNSKLIFISLSLTEVIFFTALLSLAVTAVSFFQNRLTQIPEFYLQNFYLTQKFEPVYFLISSALLLTLTLWVLLSAKKWILRSFLFLATGVWLVDYFLVGGSLQFTLPSLPANFAFVLIPAGYIWQYGPCGLTGIAFILSLWPLRLEEARRPLRLFPVLVLLPLSLAISLPTILSLQVIAQNHAFQPKLSSDFPVYYLSDSSGFAPLLFPLIITSTPGKAQQSLHLVYRHFFQKSNTASDRALVTLDEQPAQQLPLDDLRIVDLNFPFVLNGKALSFVQNGQALLVFSTTDGTTTEISSGQLSPQQLVNIAKFLIRG